MLLTGGPVTRKHFPGAVAISFIFIFLSVSNGSHPHAEGQAQALNIVGVMCTWAWTPKK
jgi:hypothetical protein